MKSNEKVGSENFCGKWSLLNKFVSLFSLVTNEERNFV